MSVDQTLPLESFRRRDRGAVERHPAALHERAETIGAAIARWAEVQGDAPALVGVDGPAVTYAQLAASISLFAHQLAKAGLACEDRVGLLIPAGMRGGELAVALACNVCLVPINPALTAHEMADLVRDNRLDAVVIPNWQTFAARATLLEQDITILQAAPRPDGTLDLELLSAAPQAPILPRPPRDIDVALLLRSSGTTGTPKLIPVTHGNLLSMASKLGSDLWFGLTSQDRAACTLSLYYAAGLKTCLFVPLILGGSVGFPPDGKTFDLGEWIDVLKPTYLSVAPGSLNGMLDRLKACKDSFDGGSLRFIMCAAAYLPEDTRLAAESMLRVPVLEFYGLSEAGVMAANPLPPRLIKPGTVGLPAPGEVLIVDSRRAPVANGVVGNIMITGPTLMPGYITTDHSKSGELKDGWLLTGDLGRIDEDGYLTIVGRVKEVINRGGEKVFPYEIEKALLLHPAVMEAAAFGVPHPRLGENVAAAAVLKPGSTVSAQDLRDFLAERLAPFKLPRHLRLVPSLPRGNTGKIMRRALTEAYAAPRPSAVAEEPDCLLELEIRELWARLLGREDVGIDEDFFDSGGDSLLATQMLTEVERLVGKPYPPAELNSFTIRRMAEVLTSGLPTDRKVITQLKSGSRMPLFYCHGDFLTRGIYAQKLAALLPDDQPVYLLACDTDDSAGSSIEEIAQGYLREVLRVAPSSPVVVGGYCNGGLAAWHLAHLLKAEGVEVAELLLVETISLNSRARLRKLAQFTAAAGAVLPARAGQVLRAAVMRSAGIWRRRLAHFTYSAARRKILSSLHWEPPPELRRHASHAGRIFLGLMSRYVPPPLDVNVTCFVAEEGRHFDTDPRSWGPLAAGVTEVGVPGTHHTAVVSERKTLALALAAAMERAAQRRRSVIG